MRPGGPVSARSVPSSGAKALMTTIGAIRLTSSCWRNSSAELSSSGPATAMPALLTRPQSRPPASAAPTSAAPRATAASSVTSNIRGEKRSPSSACSRSASACLRTLPKTRKPFAVITLAIPQPMPVETPVTTTLCTDYLLRAETRQHCRIGAGQTHRDEARNHGPLRERSCKNEGGAHAALKPCAPRHYL